MKVKAKRLGFYGNKRRNEGVSFNLKNEKDFSGSWMEEVKEGRAPSKSSKAKPAKKDAVEDLSEDVI